MVQKRDSCSLYTRAGGGEEKRRSEGVVEEGWRREEGGVGAR